MLINEDQEKGTYFKKHGTVSLSQMLSAVPGGLEGLAESGSWISEVCASYQTCAFLFEVEHTGCRNGEDKWVGCTGLMEDQEGKILVLIE